MHFGAGIVRALAVAAAVLGSLTACRRPTHYDVNVEVTRIAVVRKDEAGRPLTLDFEVRYVECPGAQMEVIRGGPEFAACVGKYEVGDKVTIGIDHEWDPEGHYKWTVRRVGDCTRVPDPNDEASYAMVRECEDSNVNGTRVGFQCKYIPEKKLVEQCPWFKRR